MKISLNAILFVDLLLGAAGHIRGENESMGQVQRRAEKVSGKKDKEGDDDDDCNQGTREKRAPLPVSPEEEVMKDECLPFF